MITRHLNKRTRNRNAHNRTGATAVEFAFTFPILFLFLFATFELGRGNMMRNTTEAAAYEAARIAIVPGSTAAEAETAARNILATSGIQNADFDIFPTDLNVDTDSVIVTVSVNYENNSILPANFLGGANFTRSCELNREKNK